MHDLTNVVREKSKDITQISSVNEWRKLAQQILDGAEAFAEGNREAEGSVDYGYDHR